MNPPPERFVNRPRLPRILTVLGLMAACLGASSENSCSFRDFLKGDSGSNDQSFVTQLALINSNGEETDTFAFGESIKMQLTVHNTGTNIAQVDFPTTRTSDFVVVGQNSDAILWQWSNLQPVFGQTLTTLTFQPDETKTFTVTWNQIGDNGIATNPGTYRARGVLVYDGFDISPLQTNNLGSTPAQFTIRRP